MLSRTPGQTARGPRPSVPRECPVAGPRTRLAALTPGQSIFRGFPQGLIPRGTACSHGPLSGSAFRDTRRDRRRPLVGGRDRQTDRHHPKQAHESAEMSYMLRVLINTVVA